MILQNGQVLDNKVISPKFWESELSVPIANLIFELCFPEFS